MHLCSFIRMLMLVAYLVFVLPAIPAYAAEPVRIGVLAYRPKPQTLAQWQPLAAALKASLPEYDFVVEALSYQELDSAVAARQLDFVLTNPGHFILLKRRRELSAPLATLAANVHGQRATAFGGVIFSRADNGSIDSLTDIKGKTVAAADIESLGAYQMQVYELSKAGIRLPQDAPVIATGMPHDTVIEAVLAGRADVGFVRSGVLEGMVREGRLEMKQLKIINRQNPPDFPLLLSTRLYPEWPFAALPDMDENLARRVAATLFVLEEHQAVVQAIGIHGFVVPADYSLVEDMLRELRLPPFESAPSFTSNDVWHRYFWQIMAALLAFGVIIFLAISLLAANRRLSTQSRILLWKQEALLESEELFKGMFMNHGAVMLLVEPESGHIMGANHAAELFYGYSQQNMLRMNISDINIQSLRSILSGKNPGMEENSDHCIFPHKLANGEIRTVEVYTSPVRRQNTTFIFSIVHDVTERTQIEATVNRLVHEQSIILENAGVGITFIKNRLFKTINSAMCRMFGYSSDEMTGASTSLLYRSREEFEKVGLEAYAVLSSGKAFTRELLLRRSDGSLFHALINGKAVSPDDPFVGSIWIISDETERYELQAKLVVARDAAESANTAKSQFLANMSHEIRTPMNGVLGMTQLLEYTDLTVEQREYVTSLKQCGKNLMSLMSDILDLSKIEAGKVTIEPVEFSLQQCLKDCIMMQKYATFSKGLTLGVDVADDIPCLLVGDQLRIKQILLNLMGNAVKFTAAGSVTVSAELLEQHETSVLVRIAVRDTGIGIAPEAVEQIFRPFIQEDGSTTRRFGGTGLGLTISRRLAELMGGTISVESTQGVGSCFSVALPFRIGTAPFIPEASPAPPPTISAWDGPPLRVLFVEDEQVNIAFGISLLKKLGHTVTTAENGRQCLAALEKAEFDIVLMDIQMPIMNGEEALAEIRAQEKGTAAHLPVIALTAYSMRGDRERLLAAGFDGYVSKPLYIQDLVVEMKRVKGEG
ncbi:MAG TPA: PhnD/SsuA/transferrin family substrate-binding protein [Desulfuromonadales bacterium]|nr:PhnD/SsuA/transferrin family substrate-binding protein [Desulfuromonadales bacterium]